MRLEARFKIFAGLPSLRLRISSAEILSLEKPIDFVPQTHIRKENLAKLRAYLGTIPNYSQTDVKGVKISGVSKNGPADKAGLKGDDIIVSLNGKIIETIYDYTDAISTLIPGIRVNIIVIRDGKRKSLPIVPNSR